jgi:hypothetical protein
MAAAIQLKHPETGILKTGFSGFSWTSFFFGGFPALFRGDVGYGLAILLGGCLAAIISFGALWFVVSVVWAAIYNKNYTHRLIQAGYRFDDSPHRVDAAKRSLGIA